MLLRKWWNILKIKTPDGLDLEINSIANLKTAIKAIFREASGEVWGPAGREPYIRTKHKEGPTGGQHNFWLTFRHYLSPSERKVYNFIFNHEGTVLLHFYGPGINWGADKELTNEAEFYSELREAVRNELRNTKITATRELVLETGKTEADIKRELEAANPGYKYINGRMVRDEEATLEEAIEDDRIIGVQHDTTQRNVATAARENIRPIRQRRKPKKSKPRNLATTRGKPVSVSERAAQRKEEDE